MRKDRGKCEADAMRRTELRLALENDAVSDVAGLKKEVEAALYRLSKLEGPGKEQENAGSGSGDGGGVEPQSDTTAGVGQAENHEAGPGDVNPSKLTVVFDEKLGREPQRDRLVRYQTNPRPDWGPMNKAKG